jgi:hypothetical protein
MVPLTRAKQGEERTPSGIAGPYQLAQIEIEIARKMPGENRRTDDMLPIYLQNGAAGETFSKGLKNE